MIRVRTLAAGASAAVAAPSLAQVDGTATWLWDVTTQNGDAIVEPGETATITLSVDMSPDVNFPDGPVIAFGAAVFNVVGEDNADNGSIVGWEILNDLDETLGDQTVTDGVSLFGVDVFNAPEILVTDDPIDIISYTWVPDAQGAYTVTYSTSTEVMNIWEGEYPDGLDLIKWDTIETMIAFDVVPGVTTPSVLVFGLAMSARRRRRNADRNVATACREGLRRRRGMSRRPTAALSSVATAGIFLTCPAARA